VIIGAEFTYTGDAHPWAKGSLVRVVAVHRDGEVLRDDRRIYHFEPDDVVEFQAWMTEEHCFSALTRTAYPWELQPVRVRP
jgi:hypothetical protein